MMQSLIIAGVRLADALREENDALSRLDLPRAATLADVKVRASDAFAAAFAAAAKTGAKPQGTERATTDALSSRLKDLGVENRRLLERAISVQSRVIETIAGAAMPRAQPTTYGGSGFRAPPRHAPSLALAARA